MYYRGAAAAILVYDITKLSSFSTLKNWIVELRANGPKDIVIAIRTTTPSPLCLLQGLSSPLCALLQATLTHPAPLYPR